MIRSLILLLLISLSTAFFLHSQVTEGQNLKVLDYSLPKEYEIADVSVSGVEFLQKEVLVSLSGLQKGRKISVPGEDITEVVKKFWSQGLFADVQITATKIEDGKIWLDIYLKERPRMSSMKLDGIGKSESQDLMEKLNIRNGSQVTDDVLNNIRRIVKDHYIEKGFLNTQITISQQPDTVRVNMVRLNVDIDKQERVKIEEIFFTGNEVFPEKKLRRVMKNTKKRNWNIFKASKLIKKEFLEDKNKLIEFYNENG
ncbi:MAG: outer membrane protein assembly factor BamA, partial [Bacteroidales bacterium]|nr:outer membrane protein assembly factor BamA [Bacteroidales bacterium]